MKHRVATRLIVVLLPAVLVLGSSPSAHAERVVTRDAAGDAVGTVYTEVAQPAGFGPPEDVPRPRHKAVDITRTVVDHDADRLRVSVDYRRLSRTFSHDQYIRVRTSDRSSFLIVAERLGGPMYPLLAGGRNFEPIQCPGIAASVDEASDRIAVTVPTACLGDPRWVRVAVHASGVDRRARTADPDPYEVFSDLGHVSGPFRPGDSRWGPEVRQG